MERTTGEPRRRRRVRPAEPDQSPAALGPTEQRSAEPASAGLASAEPVEVGPVEAGLTVSAAAIADEAVPWVAEPVAVPVDLEALPAERGLRGLVGGGSSQISPAAAMRARDAARPRPEDLARAESDLAIVRRHWSPRD